MTCVMCGSPLLKPSKRNVCSNRCYQSWAYRDHRSYWRRYYRENRDRLLAYMADYYDTHREEQKQRSRNRTKKVVRVANMEFNPDTTPPEVMDLALSIKEARIAIRQLKETPK